MQRTIAKTPPLSTGISKPFPRDGRKESRRPNVLGLFVIFAALIICCSLFYVWSHIQMVNIGYEINQANRERNGLLQDQNKLKLQIATLMSPHHVEDIAKEELRLILPQASQLVIIK